MSEPRLAPLITERHYRALRVPDDPQRTLIAADYNVSLPAPPAREATRSARDDEMD